MAEWWPMRGDWVETILIIHTGSIPVLTANKGIAQLIRALVEASIVQQIKVTGLSPVSLTDDVCNYSDLMKVDDSSERRQLISTKKKYGKNSKVSGARNIIGNTSSFGLSRLFRILG